MGVVGRVDSRDADFPRLCRSAGHPHSNERASRISRVLDRNRPFWFSLLVVSVLAAACSSSVGRSSSPTTESANPGGTAATTSTSVPNDVALRKNVTLQTCGAAPGGWSASGTAVSPGGDTTYTITIFFVTVPGNTVEGSGVTKISVPVGQTKDWKVVAKFSPTSDMQCVLRGVG